jgi:quercetin dioxygenase-like cupin family protein
MTEEPEAMRSVPGGGRTEGDPVPRVLADVRALTEQGPEPGAPSGTLWKLAESGRQLDANVIRMPPGHHVAAHAEPDLDVLMVVVGGDGTLHAADGTRQLAEGTMVWLPHGALRALSAGPRGLAYLTVHRRRPGMQIRRRSPGAS